MSSSEAVGTAVELAEVPLLSGIPTGALERLEHFMARFEIGAGERLFGQGDPGGQMYVIDCGRLEIQVAMPGGRTRALAQLGPGELLGEISLFGGVKRSATALALEPTSGWTLYRAGFEMLRLDGSPGAVEFIARLAELAAGRLRVRYQAIAAELAADSGATDSAAAATLGPGDDHLVRDGHGVSSHAAFVPTSAALATPDYLHGLLCFRDFLDDAQVAAAMGDARPVEVPRGTVVIAPNTVTTDLVLVVRGAVETSVRRGGLVQSVRLAGPGRFVGHLGVFDGAPSPVAAHARERLVAICLPSARVKAMMRDPSAVARRFCAALTEDVARALRAAERPIARTSTEVKATPVAAER